MRRLLLDVVQVEWMVLLVFCVVLWLGCRSVVFGQPVMIVEWLVLLQIVLGVLGVVVGLVQVVRLQSCLKLLVAVVAP